MVISHSFLYVYQRVYHGKKTQNHMAIFIGTRLELGAKACDSCDPCPYPAEEFLTRSQQKVSQKRLKRMEEFHVTCRVSIQVDLPFFFLNWMELDRTSTGRSPYFGGKDHRFLRGYLAKVPGYGGETHGDVT